MTSHVEVLVEKGTYEGGWEFAGSAEVNPDDPAFMSPEDTARQLWDDSYSGVQGMRRRVTFTYYGPEAPEGTVLRQREERP